MKQSAYTVNFKWNAAVWTVTSAFILFFTVLAGTLLFYSFRDHSGAALLGFFIVAVVGSAVVFVCEGYSPQCMEIGDESIVVVRRYADVAIRRSEIASVEPVAGSVLRWVNMGGSCGIFGFFGRHYAKGIGMFDLYATQFDNLFLMTTLRGKYVVSCAEPERLADYC